jgi:hypothetical protein
MDRSSEQLAWQRSSRCGSSGCIEVAFAGEHVFIRDSKNPAQQPLRFRADEWAAFRDGVVNGDFEAA